VAELSSLVRQHYDGFGENDLDKAVAVFSPDAWHQDPGGGRMDVASFRAYGEAFKTAMPDGHFEVRRMIEAPGACVVEGTFVGTQTGPLVGPAGELPASGRSVRVDFCDLFVAGADGLIAEHRVYYDQMDMLGQLGALGEPQAAAS
jgi:steroid delta-isomerase-like uncharacterized protein